MEQNIIKEYRQKITGGYSAPISIGADQFNIEPLRGSNNNNLEEQFLLGVGCEITLSNETDGIKIVKEYKGIGNISEYYKIVTKIFTNADIEDNDVLLDFSNLGISETEGELILNNTNDIYYIDNDCLIIKPYTSIVEKLYFVKGSVETLISTKTTSKIYDETSNTYKIIRGIVNEEI